MKNILFTLCASILLFSCGDIQEELVFNEDESGYYCISFDMVEGMTSMTKMMTMSFSESAGKNLDEDSLDNAIREKVWKDFPAEVDSFIDMSESFEKKGFEGEELEKLKKDFQLFIKGKKADEKLDMGLRINFRSIQELEDYWKIMGGLGNDKEMMSKVGPGIGSMFGGMNSSNDTPFMISDKGIIKPSFASSEKEKSKDKSDREFNKLMEDSSYSIIVRTAKNIKKVKGKGAKLIDENTVKVEYPVLYFMDNNPKTGFELIYAE